MATIDETMKTNFPNEKTRMVANVLFTGNWIQRQFDEHILPFGLSAQQFNVLRILRGAGDWLNMNDVKNRMVQKSPNATRLCDKLLEKSLIERKRSDSDRRVVFLKISKNGLSLLQEVDDQDDGSFLNFMEGISDEEAQVVNGILDRARR